MVSRSYPVPRSDSTLSGSRMVTLVGSIPPTPVSGVRTPAPASAHFRSPGGALGTSTTATSIPRQFALSVKAGWAPMSELAKEILGHDLRPGIWTAPFLVAANAPVARDHPDWLLRRGDGQPVRAHHTPPAWGGGWALALDMTHPGALEHVREVAAKLTAAGFSYHKVDFC